MASLHRKMGRGSDVRRPRSRSESSACHDCTRWQPQVVTAAAVATATRTATLCAVAGRFAPSPTGDLHLGNLRTAAIAWLAARSRGDDFIVRMEDLDRHQSNVAIEAAQLRDLRLLGIDWDGDVVRQSDRFDRYDAAIEHLTSRGLTYECFCTRREIRDEIEASAQAPHGPPGAYPGTCRDLTARQRSEHHRAGRTPAVRLRTDGRTIQFDDRRFGPQEGVVDDVVLRRNDGVAAYNLAVVVDDAAQGVSEVVRGVDLLTSTARQIHLQELLGYSRPSYAHVALVVDAAGERLAKRRGLPVTLPELAESGVDAGDVVAWIVSTLGPTARTGSAALGDVVDGFDPGVLPFESCPISSFPWPFPPLD